MTLPVTPLRAFFSILCVLLASVVGLVLSPIHPGWAVRLTRYVSRRMVGTPRKRRLGGVRRAQHRVPATKVNYEEAKSTSSRRELGSMGTTLHDSLRIISQDRGKENPEQKKGDLQVLPEDISSTLTNLGMLRPIARKLAKQAVAGNRDFDSALRWAIANGRAA